MATDTSHLHSQYEDHVHVHTSLVRQYLVPREVSHQKFPMRFNQLYAQTIRVSIVIFLASIPFILFPLRAAQEIIGGKFMALAIFTVIELLLVALYIWYYQLWMRKYRFIFFRDHINLREGVIRSREYHVAYNIIYRVRVRQGMFERIFGVANVLIENAPGMITDDEPANIVIWGQTLDTARELAQILERVLHGVEPL